MYIFTVGWQGSVLKANLHAGACVELAFASEWPRAAQQVLASRLGTNTVSILSSLETAQLTI